MQDGQRARGQRHVPQVMDEMGRHIPLYVHIHSVADEAQIVEGHPAAALHYQPGGPPGPREP